MDVAPKRMAHIGGTLVALVVTVTTAISGQDARDRDAEVLPRKQSANVCRVAFVGLHGGMFDVIRRFAGEAGVEVDYIRDEQILEGAVPSVPYAAVFVQHVRDDHRDQYRDFVTTVTRQNANVRIYSFSGMLERLLPDLAQAGRIEHDDKLSSYYGNSPENLRRLLLYIRAVLLGGDGPVLPPETDLPARGLYHPDHALPFDTVAAFLSWAGTRPQAQQIDLDVRVAIAVHATHAMFQQPQVVMALIREFEERGVLAVAVIDTGDESPGLLRTLNPKIVVHTCHSGDTLESRIELGVPHVHSLFFRQQSIDQWRVGSEGLAASEMAFQIVGQELLGGIEPQIGAGTTLGGGSSEAFSPIPERIAHLVDRAMAWVRLATLPREEKKVAIIYYDREMGKAELMRGSATGMFLNGPRSLVAVLKRMQQAGYLVEPVPQDEDELLASMMDHGRQIGVWAPGELERLVRSGQSVLIPLATYEHWFQQYVPEELRRQVIDKWGPPPGKFLVWHNAKGASFLVIPRIDLGNVVLLPQPLRGEAHDTTLVHDKLVPPPHNYLATYWWLQEEFRANTMIHFGTHGSEFMLPGRSTGLSDHDWPDIVLGRMPNINPWILNNLGESSPVRRRAYAVLIDHLTPPAVNAELSDELENLHNDIDHWVILEDGALKEKFRQSITEQVVRQHLDQDLQLPTLAGRQLEPTEIEQVLSYLHDIHNETTPISLHVFGQPPPENLLVPYVTTCLGKAFIRALGDAVDVPPGEAVTAGDREKYLRRIGEKIVDLVVRGGLSPTDALAASNEVNAQVAGIDALQRQLVTAQQLSEGLQQADQEMQGLLTALDGKFVEPGPGNSPDRNPGALPTGRNMYVMNPEEVPTRASWELGCQLIDQLLSQERVRRGTWPTKIGFTLNSFATFQDLGVMESQILYLIGVRPVWNERNLVTDIEVIPRESLGRPRIDVFVAGHSYYRDMLPTRMRLLDKAIRLVGGLNEADNQLFQNAQRVRQSLTDSGIDDHRATLLSTARIFGYPPGQFGSAGYYYLIEKSGEWDRSEELMETYIDHSSYVYTDGLWGVLARDAYTQHMSDTQLVLRSWSDRTRSPLSNKYDWYHGGSLCRAIEHVTGSRPDFFLSDVRDPNAVTIIEAEQALRREYHVRLFNRKWIEGMMQEGYAGADQIAVHISNSMGWSIMRPGSVSEDVWNQIVETYVRDAKRLGLREWFEAENPFAFQEVTEILLESIRKGYFTADDAAQRDILTAYVHSIARHGENAGLRSGGNEKLTAFVHEKLRELSVAIPADTMAAFDARRRDVSPSGENAMASNAVPTPKPSEAPRAVTSPEPPNESSSQFVSGVPLTQSDSITSEQRPTQLPHWTWAAAMLALIVGGFVTRRIRR